MKDEEKTKEQLLEELKAVRNLQSKHIQAKDELERIFNLTPDMICIAGSDGYFKRLNPMWEEVLGYTVEELLSKPFLEFIHPDDRMATIAEVEKLLDDRPTLNFENRYRCKEGSYRILAWRAYAAEGGLLYGAARDITEHKQVEEELRKYRESLAEMVEKRTAELQQTMIECKKAEESLRKSESNLAEAQQIALLGSWDWNIVEHILYWSDEIYRIFGLGPQEFGATYEAFLNSVHPEDRESVIKAVDDALYNSKPYSIDHRVVLPDGTERIVHEQAIVTFDAEGKPIRMVGTVQDITKRKNAEYSLMQSNKDLKISIEQLRRSNEELEQFAYVASHDLQEPLRMVASFTQLLQKRYNDRLDADAHEFISYAVEGANRMQRLINDLLSYSRIQTRGNPFKEIDCEEILGEVRINLQVSIEKSGALITNDPLPAVTGDASQLMRLFQNLIENAIKFSGKESPWIHISAKKRDNEWIFSVRDNGIGIDPQYTNWTSTCRIAGGLTASKDFMQNPNSFPL